MSAIIVALDGPAGAGKSTVARTRAHNDSERPRLVKGLEALGFSVTPSHTNFLLAHLPDGYALDMPALNVALLRRALIVRPVANYGLLRSFRVTVGTVDENTKLLTALADT